MFDQGLAYFRAGGEQQIENTCRQACCFKHLYERR
jgi:hypothetical protein